MHECKVCKFKTNNTFNYNKHLETNKHKQNFNPDNICTHCNKYYSTKYSKIRHEKQCTSNVNNLINSKVDGDAIVGNYNVINKNIININITLGSGENLPLKLTPIVEKLQKTQDKVDKFILGCMGKSEVDINTYINEMDEQLKFGIDIDNEEHLDCIERNKTNCKHIRENFMLSSDTVAIALRNALMQLDRDIVMTHEIKNLSGNKSYLFKIFDMLGDKECLKVLFDKSKYKDRINIEREIKELEKNPTFVESYKNFYKSARCRVKKLIKDNS